MYFVTRVVRHCYTLLFYLAIPFVLLRLLIRSRKQPNYRRRWRERFGNTKNTGMPSIWIHSVSVGETIAAIPFIKKLIDQYPQYNIHVTTTTPTGSKQVLEKLGDHVTHSYLPYDTPWFIKRFIKRIQPKLCIIMETEIWPNLLVICKQKHIPTILANARLSKKSMQGYARLGNIARDMLNQISCIACQSQNDYNHFNELGADPKKLTITGSIKFDRNIPNDMLVKAEALRTQWQLQDKPVIIAASTRNGEEAHILDAFLDVKKHHPHAFLLLVPRHIERKASIAKLCEARSLSYSYRSNQQAEPFNKDILIGDTIGELLLLYAIADIAFVGGSLVNTGGHNILEPAALAKPIITGPHLRNFKAISKLLIEAHGHIVVHNSHELGQKLIQLIDNKELCQATGQSAYQVYQQNQGATAKLLTLTRGQTPTNF